MSKNYLLFYLKTGGGHLAPAKSIYNYFNTNFDKEINPILCDGLEGAPSYLKTIIEDGYKKSVTKAPWVFESIYALNKLKPVSKLTAATISKLLQTNIEKQIVENKPEKIINFHFLLIKPIKEIVKRLNLNCKILTVVTDPYSAHPIWFLEKEQNYITFSEKVKRSIPNSSSTKAFPFIVNEKFINTLSDRDKDIFRVKEGISKSKTILILGGGDGMPKGNKIVKHLLKSGVQSQIIVVCGKDKSFYKKCLEYKEKYRVNNLKIYGFVPFIYQLIQVSDVVITKCGASTFMEILHSKKIPIINNYIWEQEKGNMEYVRDNKMGIYERKISKLPSLVNNLLSNNNEKSYREKIDKANLKIGTKDVGNYIYTL